MSGQIDIGWGAVPFALTELQEAKSGSSRAAAMYPCLRIRLAVQIVKRDNGVERKEGRIRSFHACLSRTLDWMYTSPDAVKMYAEIIKKPKASVIFERDQFESEGSDVA